MHFITEETNINEVFDLLNRKPFVDVGLPSVIFVLSKGPVTCAVYVLPKQMMKLKVRTVPWLKDREAISRIDPI